MVRVHAVRRIFRTLKNPSHGGLENLVTIYASYLSREFRDLIVSHRHHGCSGAV